MSFVKIMVHAVWGTKYRSPIMSDEIRESLCEHIKVNAKSKKIYIDTIDGHTDHLHCLSELNPELTISKQVQLIKGESSYWTNKNKLSPGKFGWAEDYYAVSVSPSDLDRVRAYIRNQKEHHRKLSFQEEYEMLMQQIKLEG